MGLPISSASKPSSQSKSAHTLCPGGQISIEQALIAAGVNLLLPFGPAFCFDAIVCFSLEYKILGLAGGPWLQRVSTRWFHFRSMRSRLGQALSFCFFWIKPKEEALQLSRRLRRSRPLRLIGLIG